MHPQHPFKILRRFLKGHPDLAWASTQAGFARLVGCSPGLVRAVEQRIKITPKLAMKVQNATGVSIPWLSEMQDPEKPIPTTTGKALTHEMVIQISSQAKLHPLLTGRTGLMASFISVASATADRDPSVPMARRMAVAMAKFVEDALFETLNRGDTSLMDAITKLLSQDPPASGAGTIVPTATTSAAHQHGGRTADLHAGCPQDKEQSGWLPDKDQEELMA